MAGLALAGVVVLTAVATRRIRARLHARSSPGRPFIDGVRGPETVELGVRPQHEANAAYEQLESEASDVVENSQRW